MRYQLLIILYCLSCYSAYSLADTVPVTGDNCPTFTTGFVSTPAQSCATTSQPSHVVIATVSYLTGSVTFQCVKNSDNLSLGSKSCNTGYVSKCGSQNTWDFTFSTCSTTCPAATASTTYIPYYEPNYCVPSCNAGYGLATDGVCKIMPTCGATEHRNPETMGCDLNTITCPTHQHANTANDACLADPPMGCPVGQHDPGDYTCVADTPEACGAGKYYGYINGIPQCITGSDSKQAVADLEAAKAAADAAKAALEAAQQAQQAAAEALANDPNNTELQGALDAANDGLEQAQNDYQQAEQEKEDLSKIAQQKTLESVDQTLQDIRDHKGHEASINGSQCSTPPTCAGDPVQCAILQTTFAAACEGEGATQEMADAALGEPTDEGNGVETSLASLDSSGLGLSGTCPAPRTYQIYTATVNIDLSPFCELAEIFGYLLVITCSFISIRIISI